MAMHLVLTLRIMYMAKIYRHGTVFMLPIVCVYLHSLPHTVLRKSYVE